MQNKNNAFTLVELIVVITILAILGTIAFINLQGYSGLARDSKRESDISNILKKVSLEQIKGVTGGELIDNQASKSVVINNISTNAIQGTPKFSQLKEDGTSFKDPTTKSDYVLSYAKGGTSTGAYNFLQIATINEERNEAVVKGNYYMYNTSTDSPSIVKNASNLFVVDGGSQLPYENSDILVPPISTSNILMLSRNMGSYNCVLYSTGNIKCWGNNSYGQLGDGTTNNSFIPIDVIGINNAVYVIGGDQHNATLLSDGTIKTWGRNNWGQLGDGTTIDKLTPITIPLLSGVTRLVEGFAILNDGSAKYWGPNLSNFSLVAPAVSIAKAESHKCVVLVNHTVKCMGNNWDGRLGDGTTTDSLTTPVDVVGINNAVKVMTSNDSTCAILSDGTVKCWGYNGEGQLGNGTNTNNSNPVVVTGLSDVKDIIGGYRYNIAILNDGTLKAWGLNDVGQLGDGTLTNRSIPVSIPGLSGVISVNAGYQNTCVLLSTGEVKCWGSNDYGELGDGTTNSSLAPVTVQGL